MKYTTRLTIFSTALLSTAIIFLYFLLISEVNAELAGKGLDLTYNYIGLRPVTVITITIALAYFISSVLIDRILNPLRLMVVKIREAEKMDFSKPLVIHSDDEELREYVLSYNRMSNNVSGYIERQKRFISDASHELVTPITIINGHADMLKRRWKAQPEMIDNGLAVIQGEALRMSELVDSLLLLARSDSGKQQYVFEESDLTQLIRESAAEAELIAPGFTIQLDAEIPIMVKCDEYAIRRVMRIILANAVKYAKERKYIIIKAYASHGLAHISVMDYGIGIPEEHLPYIFDRFYRVDDSRVKKTGSSGLGLAIAKEIIVAHGGSISVESRAGEGTVFNILMPLY